MSERFKAAALIALTAALLSIGGSRLSAQSADAVVPFKIRVPDAVLTDLKQRLSRARFGDEMPNSGWDYGTNVTYLKTLVDYWRDKFDWRAQERRLNRFDQFKTTLDGVSIHFIHQRSKVPDARTILLLNGWPSSIVEYEKVIEPLTDPVAHGGRPEDAFNVVIPVMPGFGFSDKPREPGFQPERIANMWVTLMARLGYSRYAVHGTDWGGGIATRVALNDPTHVFALHLAACGGAAAAGSQPAPVVTIDKTVNAAHNLGYQEIQSTKPQTLGQGLSDSPVGLASWIVEKWYDWSNHDEDDFDKTFSKDELLANIMIYWVTNSGGSSSRLYYESRHMGGTLAPTPFPQPQGRVTQPTGCGQFPWQYDRRTTPPNPDAAANRKAAEARYNVVHFVTLPKGGHFPAFEQPALWVNDLRAFFGELH
jgi:microsomal epoxide hydrolase